MVRCRSVFNVTLIVGLVLFLPLRAAAQVPAPEAFFGFKMGADGKLADWPAITKYFETVAAASPRVELVDVGPTTEGRRIIGAIISSAENIKNLSALQAANRLLADPRRLADEGERQTVLSGAKAVIAIGCSIHASEIGATQSANDLLYELATAGDARTVEILDRIVVILMPSLNPDGHQSGDRLAHEDARHAVRRRPDAVVVPASTWATTSTATPSC